MTAHDKPSPSHQARKKHAGQDIRRIKVGKREIVTEGIHVAVFLDLFHYFMTVSWPRLFATFAAFFLAFDALFALAFFAVPGCIANLNPPGLAGAFFFSVETLATVGYGDMHPQTIYGHTIAMIEIFVGLMSLAVITGLMFARFSRPRAKFMFSKNLVVRPLDGRPTLMLRAANMRLNVIHDASANMSLARNAVTQEGYYLRRIVDLKLVRSKQPLFNLGWTIMHAIDGDSPLNSETPDSLRESSASIVLIMSGTDESTGQTLTARTEYSHEDIRWNSTFHDILEENTDGSLHVDYSRFDDVEPLNGGS